MPMTVKFFNLCCLHFGLQTYRTVNFSGRNMHFVWVFDNKTTVILMSPTQQTFAIAFLHTVIICYMFQLFLGQHQHDKRYKRWVNYLYICMYVCMYVCMCICVRVYVHMHVHMYVYMYVYTDACRYACVYVCVSVRMYVCMYVYVTMYVCTYVLIIPPCCTNSAADGNVRWTQINI